MKTNTTKWAKAPNRGCKNPVSQLFKFTVVRLDDGAERFTDRKPRRDMSRIKFMAWDNENNEEVRA